MQELETKIAADKVVFNIDENNEFPTVLFEGKTFDEIAKLLGSEFIVLQDKDVIVQRVMTEDEISEIRRVYGEIAEEELPEVRNKLEEITQAYKREKEELLGQITALDNKFLDLVSVAKNGVTDYTPESDKTFRIPIAGHYLTYTYLNGKFQLAKSIPIPENQRYDLFNSSDKNSNSFEKMNYIFPKTNVENKQNYRIIGDVESGEWIEVWEENGKDVGYKHWEEEFVDEDTNEVVGISRTALIEYSFADSPYRNE